MVKTAQEKWIGKSEGCTVRFQIAGQQDAISIFTTHIETLMGVSFIGLAASHPITLSFTQKDAALREFVVSCFLLSLRSCVMSASRRTRWARAA